MTYSGLRERRKRENTKMNLKLQLNKLKLKYAMKANQIFLHNIGSSY